MNTLFNLDEYHSLPESPKVIDPSWDEVVLDCSGRIDENGQATLFYDSSSEPPDPDDYETPYDFQEAWLKWEEQFPEIAEEIKTKFKPGQQVGVLKPDSKYFGAITKVKKIVRCSVQTELWGTAGVFHWSELELVKDVEEQFLEELPQEFTEDVLEKPVKGFHFEEGEIYWHSSRNCKFKITKLLASVSKAQGYFAGEIIKEKVLLSELHPVNEDVDYPEKPSPILPEQVTVIPEKCKTNQWVESYYVTRSGSKYWYYRYCYYQKKIKHVHIPGGRVNSDKCELVKQKVEKAIALGKTPQQIEQMIKSA